MSRLTTDSSYDTSTLSITTLWLCCCASSGLAEPWMTLSPTCGFQLSPSLRSVNMSTCRSRQHTVKSMSAKHDLRPVTDHKDVFRRVKTFHFEQIFSVSDSHDKCVCVVVSVLVPLGSTWFQALATCWKSGHGSSADASQPLLLDLFRPQFLHETSAEAIGPTDQLKPSRTSRNLIHTAKICKDLQSRAAEQKGNCGELVSKSMFFTCKSLGV